MTSDQIKTKAFALGFDACGIAPAADHPELHFFREWLDRGYAGTMSYLERSADRRADVRRVLPTARTVIVTATVYNTDRYLAVVGPLASDPAVQEALARQLTQAVFTAVDVQTKVRAAIAERAPKLEFIAGK